MRFTQEKAVAMGLFLAFFLLLIISFLTYTRIDRFLSGAQWVDHTYMVLLQLNHIMSELKDAESNQRGFILTSNEKFLVPYHAAKAGIPADVQHLIALTSDNPKQHQAAKQFSELVQQRLKFLQTGIDFQLQHTSPRHPASDTLLENGRVTMEEIRDQVQTMFTTEEQLLHQRAIVIHQEAFSTKRWIIFGNMAAFLLLMIAFWLLLTEIGRRRLAQQHAETINAQLETTNKELEGFSYSVSHDLRAPLRAVDGYSRIFEEDYADKLDKEGMRLLGVIRANSRKMGQLIDDLLQFARSGRKSLDVASVEMSQLVDEVWKDVSADYTNPYMIFEKGQLLPVKADHALLKQVLTNLLSNALKYSSIRERPHISISSHAADKKGVIYQVRDNGVGFDMKYYHKLFGVFQRLHSAEEFSGTGVGLAIVQRIIVRHGGEVWAESKPGEGSTFSFNLPGG